MRRFLSAIVLISCTVAAGFSCETKDGANIDVGTIQQADDGKEVINLRYQFFSSAERASSIGIVDGDLEAAMEWWAGRIEKKCTKFRIGDEPLRLADQTGSWHLNRTPGELQEEPYNQSHDEAWDGYPPGNNNHSIEYFEMREGQESDEDDRHCYLRKTEVFYDYTYDKKGNVIEKEYRGERSWYKRIQKNCDPTHFHFGVFRAVYLRETLDNGKVVEGPGDGIVAKYGKGDEAPLGNVAAIPTNTGTKGLRHEVGHLFGLRDFDGGIMDKTGGRGHYGSYDYWGADWCKKIYDQLTSYEPCEDATNY